MATFQDTFSSTDYLLAQEGSEVESGLLIAKNIDEGTVLTFDGTNDYVAIGSPSSLDNIFSGGGTVSVWLKPDTGLATYGSPFLDKLAADAGWSLRVFNTANIRFYIYWSGIDAEYRTAAGTIPFDTWTHFAVTYNSSSTSAPVFYVNGSPVAVTTSLTPTGSYNTDAAEDLDIGRGYIVGLLAERYWDGEIDDVRVWKGTTLTAQQVQEVYSTGDNPSTPTGWWKFNDGSGNTATDSGTGGNNGDLTGHNPVWLVGSQSYYARRARATSTDLVTGLNASAVNSFAYTIGKKPGGSELRWQVSDGTALNLPDLTPVESTYTNANGDAVANTGGYSLDGVNDYIGLGASSLYTPAGTAMTTAAWVRTTNANRQRITQLLRAAGSTAFGLSMAMTTGAADEADGKPLLFYRDGANALQRVKSDVAIHDGAWHHVVGVLDNANAYLYVDGVLMASATNANAANTKAFTSDHASIGEGLTTGTWFNGSVDDVRFYHVALSADNVWELYSRHTSPSTPYGWWKLDGNANDSGSGINHGSAFGATALTEFSSLPSFGEVLGEVNTLKLDGTNDDITSNTVPVTAYPFTISAWCKVEKDQQGVIFELADSVTNNERWSVYVDPVVTGQDINFASVDGGTFSTAVGSQWSIGKWHHVVATAESSTNRRVYVDGVLVGSNTTSSTPTSIDRLRIGQSARSSGGGYFGGCIANVSVHSVALTGDQIKADFLNGYPSTTNLVAFWPLNEGTGTAADDPIGGYNGTISGATWVKDTTRPEPNTTVPQRTISLSALSLTSAAYYRALWRGLQHDRAAALNEITVDYTVTPPSTATALTATIEYTLAADLFDWRLPPEKLHYDLPDGEPEFSNAI